MRHTGMILFYTIIVTILSVRKFRQDALSSRNRRNLIHNLLANQIPILNAYSSKETPTGSPADVLMGHEGRPCGTLQPSHQAHRTGNRTWAVEACTGKLFHPIQEMIRQGPRLHAHDRYRFFSPSNARAHQLQQGDIIQ